MLLKNKGFTLIELLVVISIIALLTSVIIASFVTTKVKARDAKRVHDMDQIRKALEIYSDSTSTMPRTTRYGESNFGGVDMSAQGGFLTFLVTSGAMKKVPVDPINNNTAGNVTNINAGYSYGYYCYTPGENGNAVDMITLWYISEEKKQSVRLDFPSPTPCN